MGILSTAVNVPKLVNVWLYDFTSVFHDTLLRRGYTGLAFKLNI